MHSPRPTCQAGSKSLLRMRSRAPKGVRPHAPEHASARLGWATWQRDATPDSTGVVRRLDGDRYLAAFASSSSSSDFFAPGETSISFCAFTERLKFLIAL